MRRRSIWPGVILVVIGAAMMGMVLAADIGGTPALERLAFGLGLPGAPLAAGVGLALLLLGASLVGRARRGGPPSQ